MVVVHPRVSTYLWLRERQKRKQRRDGMGMMMPPTPYVEMIPDDHEERMQQGMHPAMVQGDQRLYEKDQQDEMDDQREKRQYDSYRRYKEDKVIKRKGMHYVHKNFHPSMTMNILSPKDVRVGQVPMEEGYDGRRRRSRSRSPRSRSRTRWDEYYSGGRRSRSRSGSRSRGRYEEYSDGRRRSMSRGRRERYDDEGYNNSMDGRDGRNNRNHMSRRRREYFGQEHATCRCVQTDDQSVVCECQHPSTSTPSQAMTTMGPGTTAQLQRVLQEHQQMDDQMRALQSRLDNMEPVVKQMKKNYS